MIYILLIPCFFISLVVLFALIQGIVDAFIEHNPLYIIIWLTAWLAAFFWWPVQGSIRRIRMKLTKKNKTKAELAQELIEVYNLKHITEEMVEDYTRHG